MNVRMLALTPLLLLFSQILPSKHPREGGTPQVSIARPRSHKDDA